MSKNKKLMECLDKVEDYLAKLSKSRAIQINLERKLKEEIKEVKEGISK